MLRIHKNQGFASMVEVIVTAIIFTIAAAGILTTVSMLKPHSAQSVRRLEAAYVGKSIIDELREQVDADTWNSAGVSDLETGVLFSDTIGIYNVIWWLEDVPGSNGGVRQLFMNVTYPE